MAQQILIIGGGVIGTACAHYLTAAGFKVSIIEQGDFGKGCSHGNCGLVCPSHVLPLAAPGAIGKTFRSLFQPRSPFSIKPRLDPALWSWLFRFARRCNQSDMLEAGAAIQRLLQSSRSLYDELFRTEPLDAEWEARGLLFVFQSAGAMEHFASGDRLLRDRFDLGASRFDGDALLGIEPALRPGLAGGWLYDTDAHLRPDRLLASWRRLLETRGVEIHERCELRGLETRAGSAQAAATSSGSLRADAFVLATGAWTPRLRLDLGCGIPIQPGKGYSITMPRPARCPAFPMIFEEHRVAVTPMRSGYRLGSILEFAGYDSSIRPGRLELLTDGARHYLQEPSADPILEQWFGWRPMTYDGMPIIDRSPALSNVYIAAGHNMLGLSMAPATGKLIAELAGGAAPHIDPSPYSAARFRRGRRR